MAQSIETENGLTSTKQAFRSGPYAELIAQGVRVGNLLHLSGQVGMDAEGVIPESIVEQASMAYANVLSVLAEFGASMDHIVDETFYVTNVDEVHEYLEPIFAARAEAYGKQPEVTQTLVGVNALFLPGLKLEVKCVAILDGN